MILGPRDYDEKRDFRRMDLDNCPLTYVVVGSGEQGTGTLRNLSGGGLLMASDKAFPPGTLLHVNVSPEKSVVPPLAATVEVVRASEAEDGGFELGAAIKSFGPQA